MPSAQGVHSPGRGLDEEAVSKLGWEGGGTGGVQTQGLASACRPAIAASTARPVDRILYSCWELGEITLSTAQHSAGQQLLLTGESFSSASVSSSCLGARTVRMIAGLGGILLISLSAL